MAETCRRCGSPKVIPGAPLTAHSGELAHFPVRVRVAGAPGALLFRATEAGEVRARVCGQCGYTELHTTNHEDLYQKYQQSLPC
jgi:ribosomal protein L40E